MNPEAATQPSQFTVLAQHYDELMDVVPYGDWVEYIQLLLSIVEHRPRRVLDCACGTGNVSFEMARQGWQVTGVDLSGGMIEVARRKAEAWPETRYPPLRFIQADLTDFDLEETFDTATCLYDSLNYILDPVALRQAFACIARHVEPDGIWVFDMNSVFALSADLFSQRNHDRRRQLHYDWHASYDEATCICTVQMQFERKQSDGSVELFHEVHRERAYPLEQVEELLRATGWHLLKTFDAYTLNPPHDRSERWYFVARKQR